MAGLTGSRFATTTMSLRSSVVPAAVVADAALAAVVTVTSIPFPPPWNYSPVVFLVAFFAVVFLAVVFLAGAFFVVFFVAFLVAGAAVTVVPTTT